MINKYLGRPTEGVVDIDVSEHQIAKEITAKRVQPWPKKGKLSAGKLSVKYAILHRIGASNWVNFCMLLEPSPNLILETIFLIKLLSIQNHVLSKLPIAFPTVLCGIMLS